ncbi:MAG: ribonuclease [Zoogloeaceae bacterium]|nr:ribonuclease [Zoogloeaceae bacterium]
MTLLHRTLAAFILFLLLTGWSGAFQNQIGSVGVKYLPVEAKTTLRLIQQGGPFPYRRDGITFENRERRLPQRPRGYYREFTVPTPGSRDRGARRIISGGEPAEEFFYTSDHYRSFRRIDLEP